MIARRDRSDGRQGGGVAIPAQDEVAGQVTLLADSEHAERSWALVHSDHGPYLVCCRYRPPIAGAVDSMRTFKEELVKYLPTCLGCAVLGGLNIHHRKWLRLSNRNSADGDELHSVCKNLGLYQAVREPTRGAILAGSCADHTNVEGIKVGVLEKIADHKPVRATLDLSAPVAHASERVVWNYRDADWELLETQLEEADWSFISDVHPEASAPRFTESILKCAHACIPSTERLSEKMRCKGSRDVFGSVPFGLRRSRPIPARPSRVHGGCFSCRRGGMLMADK